MNDTTHPSIRSVQRRWLPPVWIVRIVEGLRLRLRRLSRCLAPPPVNLMELVLGVWTAQAVHVAARLGIPDMLAEGPRDYQTLAQQTGANPQALYRLLRGLAELEILSERKHGMFALTRMGECLRTDHPFSLRYMSIFQGGYNWDHWGQMLNVVKNGESAVQQMRGESLFEYMKKHPEMNMAFDRAMTNLTRIEIEIFLSTYDFSGAKVIADIGGGQGALISSILSLNPEKRGVLFDLPEVVSGAPDLIRSYGVFDRCTVVGGSFFEEVPVHADLYILKNILHDWSDEESGSILRSIRKNIPATSKLLLLECVVPGPGRPHYAKILDLEMLVAHTGKERTAEDFGALLEANGFRIDRIIPTVSVTSIIEAVPI
ncbi:MAG TPA: methyltransferase [Burkholderiales bacterium]|nr:methyltransferase [Burkholderiales bacterium]